MQNTTYATPEIYLSNLKTRGYNPSIDPSDLERDLAAVSRYIDEKLHTFFWLDDEPTVRYYMPSTRVNPRYAGESIGWAESENPYVRLLGSYDLTIDPVSSLVGLEVVQNTNRDYDYSNETNLTIISDFLMLPRNSLTGPDPKPYDTIRRVNGTWLPASEIRVTAVFGWPQVPSAIEKLCIELAALLRIETPRATSRVSELNGTTDMAKQADYIIEGLARTYKKQPSFAGSGV